MSRCTSVICASMSHSIAECRVAKRQSDPNVVDTYLFCVAVTVRASIVAEGTTAWESTVGRNLDLHQVSEQGEPTHGS
jgi:hypothetical protein